MRILQTAYRIACDLEMAAIVAGFFMSIYVKDSIL